MQIFDVYLRPEKIIWSIVTMCIAGTRRFMLHIKCKYMKKNFFFRYYTYIFAFYHITCLLCIIQIYFFFTNTKIAYHNLFDLSMDIRFFLSKVFKFWIVTRSQKTFLLRLWSELYLD